jgi:hypothetical protein
MKVTAVTVAIVVAGGLLLGFGYAGYKQGSHERFVQQALGRMVQNGTIGPNSREEIEKGLKTSCNVWNICE